ncbi:MAG: bifunctional heptose 7-phosphate kinase/heptose 1-phosphate adenyltransferase [Phycisphaerae bacterium]
MSGDLLSLIDRFPGRRVLLVGDFMLDRYVFGDAERISPEAPVPVLRVVERQDRVGGAGSVAQNVLALDADVACFGLLGRDSFGDRVDALLREAGADTSGLLRVADRPTITKTRLVGLAEHRHRQQILRVDDETVRPPDEHDAARVREAIAAALPRCDVVCLEDYAKGLLSPELCRAVIADARRLGKPVLVDPSRQRPWEKYRGATLATPNRAELEVGCGRALADNELDGAAAELVRALELDALVVTLGRDGARLVRRGGSVQSFATRPRAVYDNTGAGDAVLAMMAVAVAAGATLEQAVPLANVAGGLEVSKFGCVPIARSEVIDELLRGRDAGARKLRSLPELLEELQARRRRGETVVFTNGCFDLLHPGHVALLEQAKSHGSVLVVGVNSDASVRAQGKGEGRPIRSERVRAQMLAALEAVDYVVLFNEPSVLPLVQKVSPEILVKGAEYRDHPAGVVGREWVESHGGRVVTVEMVEGYSTTRELERIREGGAR